MSLSASAFAFAPLALLLAVGCTLVERRAALLTWDQYGQALIVVGAIGVTLGVGVGVGGLFVE